MKKTKLLLSLAMMCLSIAVLCFGVLAATSVTYSISGTISYEVNDVFVKINTSVYAIAEQQDKTTVIATVKGMESVSQENSLSINSKTYTRTQTMDEYDSTNADTGSATGIDLTYGGTKGYYTYYIVINIQNLSSSKAVDAIITDKTTADLNSIKTTNLYQNNIASTQAKNIVIAYSIKDKTSSITNAAISYSLKVSYETKDYTNPITIEKDETNSYYYVTLGTGKVLTGTSNTVASTDSDIKWRLVSLDGVNKYTYDSSDNFEARYLSDAVFLQETAVNETLVFDSSKSQNYYNSSIRKSIKEGSYFNLTTSSDLSFVKARKIDSISYWRWGENYSLEYDSSGTKVSNLDNSTDKFWLLSSEEVNTFVGDTKESRKWMNSDNEGGVAFWLRTPRTKDTAIVLIVDSEGYLTYANLGGSSWDGAKKSVRAAFQLT